MGCSSSCMGARDVGSSGKSGASMKFLKSKDQLNVPGVREARSPLQLCPPSAVSKSNSGECLQKAARD